MKRGKKNVNNIIFFQFAEWLSIFTAWSIACCRRTRVNIINLLWLIAIRKREFPICECVARRNRTASQYNIKIIIKYNQGGPPTTYKHGNNLNGDVRLIRIVYLRIIMITSSCCWLGRYRYDKGLHARLDPFPWDFESFGFYNDVTCW